MKCFFRVAATCVSYTHPLHDGLQIFSGAYLNGADLSGANLSGANLDLANLEGANLKGARYDMNTTWPRWFNKKAAGVIFG